MLGMPLDGCAADPLKAQTANGRHRTYTALRGNKWMTTYR